MRNLTIVVLLLGLTVGAQAQDDTVSLGEVVVESDKREIASTAPLHSVMAADMARLGIVDVADALHRLPGIMLRDYGGAGGMKTVSVRGMGSQHTGVVYDGVMLSDCQSGETDLSRYSLNNIGSISLLVGDNDDIFIPARQASVPATIVIETLHDRPANNNPHLNTQLQMGSFGFVSPFVRYTQRLGQSLTLSASGEYTYAENDYPFTLRNGRMKTHEHRTNSLMNSAHGEAGIDWLISPLSRLRAKAYYYDNDRRLPGQVRYYNSLSGETLHDRNAFAQAQWTTRSANGKTALRLDGKFNWASSSYKDKLMPNAVRDADYWQREYYAAACLLYAPTERLSFDYSADYAFNNLSSSLSTSTRPYRNTLLQSLTARYSMKRLTVLGRLLWSLYYNNAKDGKSARDMKRLSPSLSLSYQLLATEPLYLRASYKNIFRAPTFNESYYYHYGSTDLEPENTDQLNIGMTWHHRWSSRLATDVIADGYLNHVTDKIVAVPYNMFIWTNINVGKVESKGVELTLKGQYMPARWQTVTVSASWSYQRVADHTNKASQYYGYQIAYQPMNTGSAAIGWENPWVSVSVHGAGMSSRWSNNNHYEGTRIAGYWETGLTLWHQFTIKRSRLTARLDLQNVLDQQYEIVSHYPMPGINWRATVSYEL